jgi:hypothetical protein
MTRTRSGEFGIGVSHGLSKTAAEKMMNEIVGLNRAGNRQADPARPPA